MRQRLLTALLITPLAIVAILLLPSASFALIVAGLFLLALWEWTRLSGLRSRLLRSLLVALAAAIMFLLWTQRGTWSWWSAIGAGCLWWLAALAWLRHFSFAATPTPVNTTLKLAGGALAVLPAWVAIAELHLAQPHLHTWALYALLLVWTADTSAFLAGSRFGKTKLAPKISPGKTIAGVVGALLGSALIAGVGGWLLAVRGMTLVALVLLGLLSVAFSIIGDLFESLIKRHANVKDSGTLFPGHGGVYDRLDSVFAALPIFALGKFVLGL
jgi:phosphatidate cytidylyltransferase